MSDLEEVVDRLVADGGLCLALAHEIQQVLLEALLAFQEAHGHVVICVTIAQLRQEGPEDRGSVSIRYIWNRYILAPPPTLHVKGRPIKKIVVFFFLELYCVEFCL